MVPKQRKRGRQGSGGNYRKRLGDAYTFAGKPHLKPVLGVLLNKRRKDVRLPYKHGIGNHVDSLAENNLNCGFYQDYLKIHSIYKDLNLNHVDIRLQSQMDTTACIFLFSDQHIAVLYTLCLLQIW